jgi:pimeloyl-ACP methyl ester carboxylesterase
MKKILFIGFCVLLNAVAFSQTGKKLRPQTPQPPFDYYSDSVEYDNSDNTVHLAATLSYPKGIGPFVTLVMITGSGQEDRDETIFDHKPFAVIADHLTRNGYAVLRVDDRGKGKSKGEVKNATSLDFADDVITSIKYLQTRKEVNKNKIGVIGHSEGGFIAPIVFTKWKNLAFIISLAGTGVSGKEILLKQQTDPVKGQVSQEAFDAFYELTDKTLSLIHDNPSAPDSVILNDVKKLYTDWKGNLPDSLKGPLRADKVTPEFYAFQLKQELIPWLRYFIATDPADFWQQVKCPVLALNGDKDLQVDAVPNITGITNALRNAGNKKLTARIIPGLNHLFQTCDKCSIEEYAKLEETFSPTALKMISDWLDKNIK